MLVRYVKSGGALIDSPTLQIYHAVALHILFEMWPKYVAEWYSLLEQTMGKNEFKCS